MTSPPQPGESAFGSWSLRRGLPVFDERAHPNDAVCEWDPVLGPATHRHWCAMGNRWLQVVFDNYGTAAIRDTARGFRWLTPVGPGSGATVVTAEGATPWATDRSRWPASWASSAPVRTWGPTWLTVAGEHAGVHVERTVACPEGDAPWVLVRSVVTATTTHRVVLTEEWEVVGVASRVDAHGVTLIDDTPPADDSAASVSAIRFASAVPPDGVDVVDGPSPGSCTVRLRRDIQLSAGEPLVWWTMLGLLDGDEVGAPADPEAVWEASLQALAGRLPSARCAAVPQLSREVPWHAALLTGGACVDGVLGGHTLDQGSAYSFDLDFNGAARDPLQHALPLVYTEPDLALSVLRNTCAWAGPDGELPYALDGAKQPVSFGYAPSDQALWSLWLAAEYAAATGDLAAFRAPAPFHPSYRAEPVPLVQHLVGQFRHLVDVVGVGAHGHIRIRNADWNDSALTLAPIDRALMQEHGESVLNSAMAAWVLPRFAGLLRRVAGPGAADGAVDDELLALADEADERAEGWRRLVAGEWNGRWFRRAYGPGAVVGDDELWLEAQPWAILCGAADQARARELLANIDRVVRCDSPLGARVRGPAPIVVPEGRVAGEGSAGGIWFSINMTLAWAAAALDADLAWDELRSMTLAAHTASYPEIWEGTLSGPDAYNTPESPRPGHTWAWPDRGIGMQSFPVNNLHAHAQVLFTYLRLLGIEPTADGALRVGGGEGTFASAVLSVDHDHGALSTRGPVRVETPTRVVECDGPSVLRW